MTDASQLLNALAFAAEKHRKQRRKDAEASPCINHPIALAQVLCNEAGITNTVVLCVALLYDTIEDTNTTTDEFGNDLVRPSPIPSSPLQTTKISRRKGGKVCRSSMRPVCLEKRSW